MSEEIQRVFENISALINLVATNSYATILSVVGIVLLVCALFFSWKATRAKPDEFSLAWKLLLFVSLVGGMGFSAAGPSYSLLVVSKNAPRPPVTASQAFDDLRVNKPVSWLIRFVVYDPTSESQLNIGQLIKLGPPAAQYVFVADYEELRGYRVAEAVRKAGGTIKPGQHVSAIIFPLRSYDLYPAGARGLLQVVRLLETEEKATLPTLFDVDSRLGSLPQGTQEITDLKRTNMVSWSWESQKPYYEDYCDAARALRCTGSYSVVSLIGRLGEDWHPLGFSQKEPAATPPCQQNLAQLCQIPDWSQALARNVANFGARVFFIKNLEIARIPGRVLIDFDEPFYQTVPNMTFDMND